VPLDTLRSGFRSTVLSLAGGTGGKTSMSFVIASPELVTAAVTQLASLNSTVSAGLVPGVCLSFPHAEVARRER
jgi:hypothetical protein